MVSNYIWICPMCNHKGNPDETGHCTKCGALSYKWVNLCPHKITLLNEDREELFMINSCKTPLRVTCESKKVGVMCGINIYITKDDTDIELPPIRRNIFYIVSRELYNKFPRKDFYVVHKTIRDSNNRILGMLGLTQPVN